MAPGSAFTMRIHPYRTVDDVIDGVVMTFIDISAQKHAVARESAAAYSACGHRRRPLAWHCVRRGSGVGPVRRRRSSRVGAPARLSAERPHGRDRPLLAHAPPRAPQRRRRLDGQRRGCSTATGHAGFIPRQRAPHRARDRQPTACEATSGAPHISRRAGNTRRHDRAPPASDAEAAYPEGRERRCSPVVTTAGRRAAEARARHAS